MAHAVSITNGGTTITLTATDIMLLDYVPASPQLSLQQAADILLDGDETFLATRRNVTESISVYIVRDTQQNLRATIESIENMLLQAEWRQRDNAGNRIYLQLQLDGDASTWRSEIVAGRLELSADSLRTWAAKAAEARIIVTRKFYWENASISELLIGSYASPGAGLGGKTVHNRFDGSQRNYVNIASTEVTGVLPSPPKITLTNNSGVSQDYRNIYLSLNAFSDPAGYTPTLEAGSARGGSGSVTTGDTSCSNDDRIGQTFSGTHTMKWDLSTGLLADIAGRFVRLLTRFSSYSNGVYCRPSVQDSSALNDIYVGDEILLPYSNGSYELVDLGVLPLPPGGYSTSWGQMVLALTFRASSSVTVNLDCINLTTLDSYRHLVQRGLALTNGEAIIDDGLEGIVSAGGQAIISPRGRPIHLLPGYTQRLHVLHDEGLTSPIGNSFSVQIHFRPRRLTV